LLHCDFVYAAENAKFQMPHQSRSGAGIWIELGWFGENRPVRAARVDFSGIAFDARRAADLGFVTQVVPDQSLLATATETGAETGSEAGRRAAGQQKTSEALIPRTAQGGNDGRDAEFSGEVH